MKKHLIVAVMIAATAAMAVVATEARANDVVDSPTVTGGTAGFFAIHTDSRPFTDIFTFSVSGSVLADADLITGAFSPVPGARNIDFFSADLNGVGSFIFPLSPAPGGSLEFGFLLSTPLAGPLVLTVHGTTDAGGGHNSSYAGTLNVASVSVPEPASLMLLGAGLAGIGIWRRKSTKV